MRKPLSIFFIAAILPALLLSACGHGKAAVNVAASQLSRIENPNIPVSDQE